MPDPDNKQYSVDELIKNHKVPVVAANVPARTSITADKDKPANGAAFRGQDGRMMYRYNLNGETIILPKPVEQMSEQDFYNLPITSIGPVTGRIPQNLNVKFKDPQWAGYWFNRSAKDGMRIGVARSLGFVPAKLDDIEKMGAALLDQNGAVEQNDLVLMKVHKAKLYMRYKEAIDAAKQQGSIGGYKNAAISYVQQGGGDISKGQYYHTPQAINEFQGLGPVTNLSTVEGK